MRRAGEDERTTTTASNASVTPGRDATSGSDRLAARGSSDCIGLRHNLKIGFAKLVGGREDRDAIVFRAGIVQAVAKVEAAPPGAIAMSCR